MAPEGQADAGLGPTPPTAARVFRELDIGRIRATDFARYWPSSRIALRLIAESAEGALAAQLLTLLVLGDAICADTE